MTGQLTKKLHPSIPVTDDWPECLPITEAELELYEHHLLDIIAAMVQHGD